MIFNKKSNKKCESCGSHLEANFKFCPRCGNSLTNRKNDKENYGLLGKEDSSEIEQSMFPSNLGITDKMLNSAINGIMKSFAKQLGNQMPELDEEENKPEIKTLPNGISIKISGPFPGKAIQRKPPQKKVVRQPIDEEQAKKMNELPKGKAKTSVKRLGDKVVYELAIPGLTSPKDIFVSKLESGYEIKAIGAKKVYINSVPINLPLARYTISKDKLSVEFKTDEQS